MLAIKSQRFSSLGKLNGNFDAQEKSSGRVDARIADIYINYLYKRLSMGIAYW